MNRNERVFQMKKVFLLAVVASLFSLMAQTSESFAAHYRPYGRVTSYANGSESNLPESYRSEYYQPTPYPRAAEVKSAPDFPYQKIPSDTMRIRPVIGFDYVYSIADFDNEDTPDGDLDLYRKKLNALAVSAGVKFNQYVGIEAFYQQSEKISKKTYVSEDKYYDIEEQYRAYGLDLIGYYPVISQVDLIGSLGAAYFQAKVQEFTNNLSETRDKFGVRVGAGLQLYITEYLAARIMARYNYMNMSGLDNIIDLTAGVRVYF